MLIAVIYDMIDESGGHYDLIRNFTDVLVTGTVLQKTRFSKQNETLFSQPKIWVLLFFLAFMTVSQILPHHHANFDNLFIYKRAAMPVRKVGIFGVEDNLLPDDLMFELTEFLDMVSIPFVTVQPSLFSLVIFFFIFQTHFQAVFNWEDMNPEGSQ